MAVCSRVIKGLSPLARGNLRPAALGTVFGGTIPARAGEPLRHVCVSPFRGDYPRSRGGTMRQIIGQTAGMGLSPLARGNQRNASGLQP